MIFKNRFERLYERITAYGGHKYTGCPQKGGSFFNGPKKGKPSKKKKNYNGVCPPPL